MKEHLKGTFCMYLCNVNVWDFVQFIFGLHNKYHFLCVTIVIIKQFSIFSGKANTTAYAVLMPTIKKSATEIIQIKIKKNKINHIQMMINQQLHQIYKGHNTLQWALDCPSWCKVYANFTDKDKSM